MKRNKKLKYIIVGYGNIGHKRHDVLGKRCLATIDPNPKSGAKFRSSKDIPHNVVDKVSAVIVTIPRFAKIEEIAYWLGKGKNVLVEKPLIIKPAEASKLQKIARKNKVVWYTAYNYRFEPHIIKIKKLLDKDFLGKTYNTRMVYGFGNVRQLMGTWREEGSGVIEEVSCHLLDLSCWLLGYKETDFIPVSLRKIEAKTYDHALIGTRDLKVLTESSWIMWKNQFTIEIYGERGSLHMNGLCKWGDSELLVRQRVLPAGVPKQKRYVEKGRPDPTWKKDIQHFEKTLELKKTSITSDLKLTRALISILTADKKIKTEKAYTMLRGKS